MAQRSTPDDSTIAGTGSARWQRPAIATDSSALTGYLDRVATFPLLRDVAVQALELLQLQPGQRVLEVGCGAGVFLPLLAQAVGPAGRVVGIDHAPEFVATARERMASEDLEQRVTVREADAYHLPFAAGEFAAAHCERVLMHLEDPLAALLEIRRVVAAGGWVVAAEPHWRGVQIDHPDREALDLLFGRWLQRTRNPAMGLELNRRFADAGLVERHVVPVMEYAMSIDHLVAYGLDLPAAAAELQADGALPPERAARALAYLTEASQAQSLSTHAGFFIVAGRVPLL